MLKLTYFGLYVAHFGDLLLTAKLCVALTRALNNYQQKNRCLKSSQQIFQSFFYVSYSIQCRYIRLCGFKQVKKQKQQLINKRIYYHSFKFFTINLINLINFIFLIIILYFNINTVAGGQLQQGDAGLEEYRSRVYALVQQPPVEGC